MVSAPPLGCLRGTSEPIYGKADSSFVSSPNSSLVGWYLSFRAGTLELLLVLNLQACSVVAATSHPLRTAFTFLPAAISAHSDSSIVSKSCFFNTYPGEPALHSGGRNGLPSVSVRHILPFLKGEVVNDKVAPCHSRPKPQPSQWPARLYVVCLTLPALISPSQSPSTLSSPAAPPSLARRHVRHTFHCTSFLCLPPHSWLSHCGTLFRCHL